MLRTAVPSTVAEGFLALPSAQHGLVLAAHSWAHEPLRRLRDLVDIAAVAADADRSQVETIAEKWGIARLWRSTDDAIVSTLADSETPLSIRIWARNLAQVRERTVLENHLERWLSDFWILAPIREWWKRSRRGCR